MFLAVRLADAFEPRINGLEVVDHAVVRRRFELVRIEELNLAPLPTCTDCLLSSLASSPYLYVNHVVLLSAELCVEVCGRDEHKVTRLQVLLFDRKRQCVPLIRLIPSVKGEPKLIA